MSTSVSVIRGGRFACVAVSDLRLDPKPRVLLDLEDRTRTTSQGMAPSRISLLAWSGRAARVGSPAKKIREKTLTSRVIPHPSRFGHMG